LSKLQLVLADVKFTSTLMKKANTLYLKCKLKQDTIIHVIYTGIAG